MKKIYYVLALLLALPATAFAHVKWFAKPIGIEEPYKLTDTIVIVWIIVSIILITIGVVLEKKLKIPKWFGSHINNWKAGALSIASIGFGLSFLIFSLKGFIFAPNLAPVGTIGMWMLLIQAVAGAMILLGFYERVGGFLIILLFMLGVKVYGGIEMLDTMEMLGFAFYAIIIGRPKWKIRDLNISTDRLKPYGLPILRIGTGLNLIILGFTEKILATPLTSDFLSHYNWNFMQTLGFSSFTNHWFAFSAGMVEVLFGIFFLLGLVTRTTTLVLAVFLISTLILLGPLELIGHLPHFSIAIVLLILGSGSKLILVKNK